MFSEKMENLSPVIQALNKTSKGKLKYDSNWLADGDIEVRVLSVTNRALAQLWQSAYAAFFPFAFLT